VEYKGYDRKEEEECGELKTISTRTKIHYPSPSWVQSHFPCWVYHENQLHNNKLHTVISMRNKKTEN